MLAGLVLVAAGTGSAEEPVVYKWVDENGVAHFTTKRSRIPDEFEDSAEEIRRAPAVATSPAPGPSVSRPEAEPVRTPAAAPPAVAAPPPEPPAPRVVPDAEFEEAPLGSERPAPATTAPVPSAAAPPPVVDAPPPGFVRGQPGARAANTPPEDENAALSAEQEDELDRRIAALEAEVESEQTKLENLLSDPATASGPRIAEREDFRAIALRLPQLQADLKSLRERRTRASGL